jgi:patatin-like phospholipase/acyl hydrolase
MRKLDEKVDRMAEQPLLPCQYFDLIAGTSTGG